MTAHDVPDELVQAAAEAAWGSLPSTVQEYYGERRDRWERSVGVALQAAFAKLEQVGWFHGDGVNVTAFRAVREGEPAHPEQWKPVYALAREVRRQGATTDDEGAK